jgi:hypothetical protein
VGRDLHGLGTIERTSSDNPGSARTFAELPRAEGAAVSGSGTTLDDYTDRYAQRVRGMTASEIRALFAVASRPEVVSLAGGAPYVSALPLDAVGETLRQLAVDHGATTLQYGIGQGTLELRERICELMATSGIDGELGASPEDVVVTVGGQQALDLVARLFLDPGDVVLAEGPTYVGALGVFQAAQAQVVGRDVGDPAHQTFVEGQPFLMANNRLMVIHGGTSEAFLTESQPRAMRSLCGTWTGCWKGAGGSGKCAAPSSLKWCCGIT